MGGGRRRLCRCPRRCPRPCRVLICERLISSWSHRVWVGILPCCSCGPRPQEQLRQNWIKDTNSGRFPFSD